MSSTFELSQCIKIRPLKFLMKNVNKDDTHHMLIRISYSLHCIINDAFEKKNCPNLLDVNHLFNLIEVFVSQILTKQNLKTCSQYCTLGAGSAENNYF